ncbi:hypothetical protein SCHPADRAFT_582163 [Schizopora paradoxa]|uniref:Dystroglycan-type cadherin-like domain-containing protein n=1 Tax=Schizopora paradoxa TaxID=27342 RepID=A0A0H2RW93_9AGAM|nr:hypothetical protein SCHPADRAFT_582163 [Schizopora paradoxa]
MHATAALFGLLASAQVVFANFTFVHFSGVNQCGPFSVNFTGGQLPTALPLTITVVPFFARPVSIPIPLSGWDEVTQSGSAVVDFLPLFGNTQFVASLDDADGNSLGFVSDVMKVNPSNDTFCLPPRPSHGGKDSDDDSSSSSSSTSTSDFYNVKGTLNQCAQFNVTFKRSLITNPPTIRAFIPRAVSYFVNTTTRTLEGLDSVNTTVEGHINSTLAATTRMRRRRKGSGKDSSGKDDDDDDDDDDDGRGDSDNNNRGNNNGNENSFQPFVLNVIHGEQVVLLFNDTKGHAQTSPLITVGGDAGSPTSCFKSLDAPISMTKTTSRTSTSSNTLKTVIAVVSSIVVLLIGAFMVFIIRRKRLHLMRGEVRRSMSFNWTEDISMGTGSFIDRVYSRVSHFWSSPQPMSPRAPLVATKARSFGRLSNFDEKTDLEAGKSEFDDDKSSLNSWSIVQEFPKVPPVAPSRPYRSTGMFSLGEVERALDTQLYHMRGSSEKSLRLTPQPQAPIIVTPSSRPRSDPDAPRSAVPSALSSARYSSSSSFTSPKRSPFVRVLKAQPPSDDTSSFFDTCSILSSSNFVPNPTRSPEKADRRT